MTTETFLTRFYTLPAELVEEGMSTADGQDVLHVDTSGGNVFLTVYTPRSDDPEQDAENRTGTECRMVERGARVDLAVFEDTTNDGSEHPAADVLSVSDSEAAEGR